jgi:hypothetical protein
MEPRDVNFTAAALGHEIVAAAKMSPKTKLVMLYPLVEYSARAQIGDPMCTHNCEYATGMGFSKACALKCLIATGTDQAGTVQARLLAAGLSARILDVASLATVQHSEGIVRRLFEQKNCQKDAGGSKNSYSSVSRDPLAGPLLQVFGVRQPLLFPAGDSIVAPGRKAVSRWKDRDLLAEQLGGKRLNMLSKVKVGEGAGGFADPDLSSAMSTAGLSARTTFGKFSEKNISVTELLDPIFSDQLAMDACGDTGPLVEAEAAMSYFTELKGELYGDDAALMRSLYQTNEDFKRKKQFLWISTKGTKTHTHFDQDHNVFVQVVGSKRKCPCHPRW